MWFWPDSQARIIKKFQQRVPNINSCLKEFDAFDVARIRERTLALKERLAKGETLDDILEEAFALVKAAAHKTIGLRHYDVQLVGGMVLHTGKIAEMKTGEGKTLVATLPAYLNALAGKGVHIVTVNDYLARRDAVWMGQVFWALGLSVGCLTHEQTYVYHEEETQLYEKLDQEHDAQGGVKVMKEYLKPVTRKEAYAADITYGTNNEFGFDYLRDNLVLSAQEACQRGHHFAVIDEVDSILIDEARTPLIISMQDEESTKLYGQFARIMPRLVESKHYKIDEKLRAVTLTEEGIMEVERILGVENIYDTTIFGSSGIRYLHHLEQALKAQALFKRDKDYIVKNGEIIIVDEFTGRMMPGRRYSEGLHQAIEAKEGVTVQRESRTLASITFQNYFRMYEKLSGMTGTAMTSAEEFSKVYKLDVLQIPSNKPNIRQDLPDAVYKNEKGKYEAVVREIKERHERGQPVLVGTVSIAKNEHLSALLKRDGIRHELLNAKNHEREAEIIAQAGKLGAVTVATNMAGRGVDIILGGNPADEEEAKKIRELGGLAVVGTQRHEARRIDNQLRGRSGRQGDPGTSQFFIGMDDDLMRIFGSDRIKNMMDTFGIADDQPIESGMVSKAIETAQKKIEGHHFDSRKHVLEYDEVMNKHREVVYGMRKEIIAEESARGKVMEIAQEHIEAVVRAHTEDEYAEHWNTEEILENMKAMLALPQDAEQALGALKEEEIDPRDKREKVISYFVAILEQAYEEKTKELSEGEFNRAARLVMLRNIDTLWMDHLENMEHMQDSVRLRAYGQHDPLIEYKNEGHRMFKEMLAAINYNIATTIFKISAKQMPHVHAQSAPQIILGIPGQEAAASPVSPAASVAPIGRNDPCPCGAINPETGQVYKYKRCGLINAPYHKG